MSLQAPTHHISAKPGDFAKTVLMPGDPLRAKYIAENFMTDVVCVNEIRCMYAYTGNYKGRRVSVMAGGMGGPSTATHAYELYKLYDVDNIIRVGTAGGIAPELNVNDIVIAMGGCHNSSCHVQYKLQGTFAPIASYSLLRKATEKADEMKVPYTVGNVYSSDCFYNDSFEETLRWGKMGIQCVEMETSTLYITAASMGKNALSILTISDHLLKEEKMSPEARQEGCLVMMELALELA